MVIITVIVAVVSAALYELERPAAPVAPPWGGTTSIDFSCTHAIVSILSSPNRAVLVCNNVTSSPTNTTTLLACTSAVCTGTVTFGTLGGYIFSNWTSSGDVYFGTSGSGCSTVQTAGRQQVSGVGWLICMTVSSAADHYSGSVVLNAV